MQLAELLLRHGDRARALATLRRRAGRSGRCAIKLAELHTERDEIRDAIEVLEKRTAREALPDVTWTSRSGRRVAVRRRPFRCRGRPCSVSASSAPNPMRTPTRFSVCRKSSTAL